MKMKQLVTTAAVLVAISMAAPSAFAITAAQAKAVKKAVISVPVPEMPAKAAELVTQASKEDREAVALTAVRAAIYKSRASAPLVVSAVAKVAPELAATISMAAAEMESSQATFIASAASQAAPQAKADIQISVSRGAATASRAGFTTRASAGGGGNPTVTQLNTPINNTQGGNGGTFTGAQNNPGGTPTLLDYTQPRTP